MCRLKNNRLYIILFICLILTSMSHYYTDVNSITRQGMMVWEALFSGRFFEYYTLNKEVADAGLMFHDANYDMILNILIGIWQLPLYLLEKIIGGNILNYFFAKAYSKLYLVILIFLCGNVLKKIARELNLEKDCDNIFFMFVTSVFTIMSSAVIGQVDILGLFFILYALYYLIKNDEKKFILFFILAAQCKFFALFFFLPIILLHEKRIWKIIVYMTSPLILSFFVSLPFKILDPGSTEGQTQRLKWAFEDLFRSRIRIFNYDIPTILILFSIICIVVYLIKIDKHEMKVKWYIYSAFLSMIALFSVMQVMPYWLVYLAPFITLQFFMKETGKNKLLILETVCSWCMSIGLIMSHYWCFSAFHGMLIGQLGVRPEKYLRIQTIWEKFGHASYYMGWTITFAIFFGWLIVMAVYFCPYFTKENQSTETDEISMGLRIRAIGNFILPNIGIIFYVIGKVING